MINSRILVAQEKPYNFIKFGIRGTGGITDTSYLNSMVNEWYESVVDASNAELQGELIALPVNVEYGYQPFVLIRPLRFIQIGAKMDYTFSSLSGKFQNPITNEKYELSFRAKSYIPSLFAVLALGKLEAGGGVFRSYTNIQVNDNFFGYSDSWFGTNTGYELSLGFSSTSKKHVGFTMGIKYRDLFIESFSDSLNRRITYTNSTEDMSLGMSGFIFELGLYFQFIKINK
jgi:hypothetical protein